MMHLLFEIHSQINTLFRQLSLLLFFIYCTILLSNVFLFTWEEKYLLDKEISRRKLNFAEKFGKEAIFAFNNENFDLGQVKQSIFAGWLFVSKKLIIIQWLPTDGDTSNKIWAEITESLTNEIIDKEGKIPDDTILIFASYKPDKRGRLYKFLEKNAVIKLFNKLSPIELKNFVKNETKWLNIDYDTIEYFLVKVGENLYNIISECEKLRTRCWLKNTEKINIDTIDLVSFGQTETNSFAFFDNFFDHQQKNLGIIDKIQEEGTNWNLFMGSLYRGLRVYIYILDLNEQGITDSKTIASMTKQSPYSITKQLKNIKKMQDKKDYIKKFFKNLIVLDNKIKSGKVPDSYFRLWIKKIIMDQ